MERSVVEQMHALLEEGTSPDRIRELFPNHEEALRGVLDARRQEFATRINGGPVDLPADVPIEPGAGRRVEVVFDDEPEWDAVDGRSVG